MAERALIYKLTLKERYRRGGSPCLLGDIDGRSRALVDVLAGMTGQHVLASGDSGTTLTCAESSLRGSHDVAVSLDLSESKVVADIKDEEGQQAYRRRYSDSQVIRCLALFRLPKDASYGFVALHTTDGRAYKTLLAEMLKQCLLPVGNLTLVLEPVTEGEIVRQAIERGAIKSVTLQRFVDPGDQADRESSGPWIPAGEYGSIKVVFSPARGKRLSAEPIKRFFSSKSKTEALKSLATFQGSEFDEVKIEAQLGKGRTRTYNVHSPESGHPFSIDLDDLTPADGADGGFTEESILERLEALLDEKMP